MKTLTPEQLIEARDRLHQLNQEMEERKEEQLQIREYLAERLHDGEEGAKTITIEGVKVTVTRNLNRKIDKASAERLRLEHPDLYATVLRFTPEVRVGEYKKNADVMDEFIESKPGPPTIVFA